ncbi:AbiV family abortive infection protein [Roseateles sp. 22389]|uniref:AbiV family abortive infection protein n=1 Tax=Roseateles sp. 22389 TaxID=3453916 RepID=UPI003F83AC5C
MNQFNGPLNIEQLAEGMNLAKKNASRLHDDAKLLLEAGRYASAMSLAILAIEEAGKLSILRRMVSEKAPEQLKGLWKEYRSHTKKNAAWTLLEHIKLDGRTKLQDLAHLFDSDSDHPYILDQIKQLAFYTDCLGQGNWTYPEDVITEHLVRSIMLVARAQSGDRQTTSRELELWELHVGDATRFATQREGNEAIAAWYGAMQAEGLFEPGPNRMQEFITEGINVVRDHR